MIKVQIWLYFELTKHFKLQIRKWSYVYTQYNFDISQLNITQYWTQRGIQQAWLKFRCWTKKDTDILPLWASFLVSFCDTVGEKLPLCIERALCLKLINVTSDGWVIVGRCEYLAMENHHKLVYRINTSITRSLNGSKVMIKTKIHSHSYVLFVKFFIQKYWQSDDYL